MQRHSENKTTTLDGRISRKESTRLVLMMAKQERKELLQSIKEQRKRITPDESTIAKFSNRLSELKLVIDNLQKEYDILH